MRVHRLTTSAVCSVQFVGMASELPESAEVMVEGVIGGSVSMTCFTVGASLPHGKSRALLGDCIRMISTAGRMGAESGRTGEDGAMTRPNLLLFMTDQQRADSIGAFGNGVARTPNFDALAKRGTRFTQAFSQHSACSQSRISMFTGWYPHVAGHRTLDNLLKPWEPNLLATLRSAGYFVAWAGGRGDTFAPGGTAASTDFFGYLVKPSLEAVAAPHGRPFPSGHPLHHAHYVGRLDDGLGPDFDEASILTAISLLEDGLREPFVLVLTLFAPHPPFAVADPWFSLHDRVDMPEPAPIRIGEPEFMATLRHRSGLDRLGGQHWAEIAATYYGMVSRLDEQLGRVLAALERTGALERTVVASFTDHGEYLGDFGLVEKWPSGLDDCLLRNPLVMAGPGIHEGAAHDDLVEMVDLLPTLCELAETEVVHPQFGRSLVATLAGSPGDGRSAAFSEGGFRLDEESQNEPHAEHPYDVKTALLHERPDLVGRALAVRTPEWTYVYRTCESDELYRRDFDPVERTNVAGDPDNSEVIAVLRDLLLRWLANTSDVIPTTRDPRMEPALVESMTLDGP
jgi:arylsulfatase A-like enzyme